MCRDAFWGAVGKLRAYLSEGWRSNLPPEQSRQLLDDILNSSGKKCVEGNHFIGKNLSGVSFVDVDLSRCRLDHADLSYASFDGAQRLNAENFAGANLRGATMPSSFAFDIDSINDLVKTCRSISVTLLVSSIYIIIAAASTKDVDLLTASRRFTLPIVNAEISLFGFYAFGPVALIAFGLFFYMITRTLLDRLARLPAVFPNGSPSDEAVSPWLTTELIRWRQPRLRSSITPGWFFRTFGIISLTWLVVPSALAFIWLRYLKRHDAALTTVHVVLFTLSFFLSSVFLYLSATGRQWTYRVTAAFLLTAGAALVPTAYVSYAVLKGGALPIPLATVLGYVGYKANLDLTGAIVSRRPDNWSPAGDAQFQEVTGADLAHSSLRNADAKHVFLARANLTQADMRNARLTRARMQFADLTEVDGDNTIMDDIDFRGAHLHGARFRKAQASGASFDSAVLKNSIFSGAILANSIFKGADLDDARFDGAYLRDAKIFSSRMRRIDLRSAMLYEAVVEADLSEARLDNANLRGADLSRSTGLTQRQVDLACLDERTKLPAGLVANTKQNPECQ